MRLIDANRFGEIMEQWKKDCLADNDTQGADIISDVMLQLNDMPTITLSNDCEYCSGEPMRPLDWQYGLYHIFPDYKYCPMCGRRVQK